MKYIFFEFFNCNLSIKSEINYLEFAVISMHNAPGRGLAMCGIKYGVGKTIQRLNGRKIMEDKDYSNLKDKNDAQKPD